MSVTQVPALSDLKAATKFMTESSASFWVSAGEKRALEVFHTAATKVAAYRDFLEGQDLDHTRVRTIDQFRELVPISDRRSHFAGNALERLVTGDVTDAQVFFMSGGTTGDSLIGATDRETMRSFPGPLAAVLDAQWGIADPHKKVLMVNALSLGAWVGGTYVTAIFTAISDSFENIAYAGPGADVDRILDIVEAIGMHFDMIVLISYPTFIKELLRAGEKRDIDWRARAVKIMVSGERMDSKMRLDILEMISSPVDHYALMNQYGSTEMGNPGSETPVATTIIRLASENSELCRAIFGEDAPLTLLQSNPVGTYVEVVDSKVIGTSGGLMPVVRYSPKDTGRFFGFDEMNCVLQDHGINLAKALVEHGWHKPVVRWPFLVLGLRADHAVSIYGAKVSVLNIQDIFSADDRVQSFLLMTDSDGEYTTLMLHIELPRDASLPEDERQALSEHYARTVFERLLEVNFDYRDAWHIHADAMTPRVHVHDFASGPFEARKGALKHKGPA